MCLTKISNTIHNQSFDVNHSTSIPPLLISFLDQHRYSSDARRLALTMYCMVGVSKVP